MALYLFYLVGYCMNSNMFANIPMRILKDKCKNDKIKYSLFEFIGIKTDGCGRYCDFVFSHRIDIDESAELVLLEYRKILESLQENDAHFAIEGDMIHQKGRSFGFCIKIGLPIKINFGIDIYDEIGNRGGLQLYCENTVRPSFNTQTAFVDLQAR